MTTESFLNPFSQAFFMVVGMRTEVIPCIINSTTNSPFYYSDFKQLVDVIKNNSDKLGVDEKYVNDFINDVNNSDTAICVRDEDRLIAYETIIEFLIDYMY